MKKLFTIGYGSDIPEDFVKRLKDAGITAVLDVRREHSKSWCGSYKPGLRWMGKFLSDAGIGYGAWHSLGNNFDALWAYQEWLESKPTSTTSARGYLTMLQYELKKGEDDVYSLLCSERKAYRGGKVNCHRVYVADALVAMLGEGWEVIHL